MKRVVLLLPLLLCACDLSMTQQNRHATESQRAGGRSSARVLPEHVIAQGDLARAREAKNPPQADAALLARGRERFIIYCSPCHGVDGRGDGPVVARGFPSPPSYLDASMLAMGATHLYDVISNGYGRMYGFADRIGPRDRWAIVAYVRALQLAQQASRQGPERRP